ncbi:MAG TPA: tetratricopeptide repeat protein, partial [Tepidisphaeraceae bacterium]|nr:tetratricopeptide repeat protein [Tepidisphaeraceae bacterium]
RRYMEARAMGGGGAQLDAVRNYLDVFDRYSRLSRDPTAAGVAAVVTAGEILRARGADTAIAYFNKVMPDVKNESVQRAIRLQLIELYKMSGQQDKALEHLQNLMTSAPGGAATGAAGEGEGAVRARQQ